MHALQQQGVVELIGGRRTFRADRLAKADPEGWHLHTPYHWSRMFLGWRLDYWPTTKKFMWKNVVYPGFIPMFGKHDGPFMSNVDAFMAFWESVQ